MGYIKGVNLLPSTGEFAYDTIGYLGQRVTESTLTSINRYASGGAGATTDYTIAIDNLQAEFPDCETVSLVVAWFGSSTDVAACQIFPSTTYINGRFQQASGGADEWRCSGLTQSSAGLIPIPQEGDSFIYGGTPSDQSIVRCIQDLKSRGLRAVFSPFILMTADGKPWRGRITYTGADISSAAAAAVNAFLGSAIPSQFTRDPTNLTVGYAGAATDYTYRRMILHYANLCVLAGGVDLFLIGSEFRGLEAVRGAAWTKAGTISGGIVTWDYPFVAGLAALAEDVRGIFDAAGLLKDTSGLHNLVSYSADWSVWMGYQHPGENGQWAHLDQLYAHANIDVVCFDNYLPLSDWTTGDGGLDAQHWLDPRPGGVWPPAAPTFNGLGLSGQPTIYSKDYLKANIEGGEKFDWFYADSSNRGIGFDPNGTDLRVSLPQGDRLTQSRNAYAAGQEVLANKKLRWWWNNSHRAVYDTGSGWTPQGSPTAWVPQSKPVAFSEYGFPACDRGTNQPNVFYAPGSTESFTPFWSIWDPSQSAAGNFSPRRDDELQLLALQAVYEYWVSDGNNETSAGGVPMLQTAFMSAWNWDARPFPTFPRLAGVWGDSGNWPAGNWVGGKGPFLTRLVPDDPPAPGYYRTFPAVPTPGWSVKISPVFSTATALHVSGREVRAAKFAAPLFLIELNYDVLRMAAPYLELAEIIGFFATSGGENVPFYFEPPQLSPVAGGRLGIGDGSAPTFSFAVPVGGYALTPANVSVLAVYLDGVKQSGGYAIDSTALAPSVVFTSPPAAGVAVTADFRWYFLCCFDDDSEDVEEFMSTLYALQSLKLRTVRS